MLPNPARVGVREARRSCLRASPLLRLLFLVLLRQPLLLLLPCTLRPAARGCVWLHIPAPSPGHSASRSPTAARRREPGNPGLQNRSTTTPPPAAQPRSPLTCDSFSPDSGDGVWVGGRQEERRLSMDREQDWRLLPIRPGAPLPLSHLGLNWPHVSACTTAARVRIQGCSPWEGLLERKL